MFIVSMTTIPCRQARLEENIESLLNQSCIFDKLVINIDDNLTQEDYQWYDKFAERDWRIEVSRCDAKWRSCNKLLPTLKKYPDDVIITVDDDIYYPVDSIRCLVESYIKNPDCIIAHEVNPITVSESIEFLGYNDDMDVKLNFREYGKYLSNCCLFPPHIFDGSDLHDYDKMMECTGGCHDELWFWVNSTINGVPVINLDYVVTFMTDIKTKWDDSEYRLRDTIKEEEYMDEYNKKIIEMYGDKINKVLADYIPTFILTKDNIYAFICQFDIIKKYYMYRKDTVVSLKNLTSSYQSSICNFLKMQEISIN